MTSIVHVEVSGLTGSGKSAVMGEIEIALKALGLKVETGPDFQAEKNGTHADWQAALDLYQPTVVLTERNVSRQPQAREDAQPVISAGRVLADALRQYGFPVSGGAKAALSDHGSAEALALNEACVAFLAALQAEQKGGAA